jgi:nucleoid DNA-binding protein
MVVDVINEYLKSNRRLVIPSFGAFVTKEDGQIIFSELLKKDDGILRGLLVAKGLREIEAAGKIDRFVFEIRHALMQVGACPVADFGTFYRTAEGVVTFDATKPILEPIPAVAEPAADVVPAAVTPTPTPTPAPAPAAIAGPSSTTTSRRPRRKSRGGGFAMIVAIIAIVAALAALAYGIYTMVTVPNDNLDQQMDALRIPKIDVPKY